MIETLPDTAVYWGGFAIVTLLVAGRLYVGEHYFDDRSWFWRPLRRAVIPLLHRLFQRADDELYAETSIGEDEHIRTVTDTPDDVLEELADVDYEPQPLASLAADWEGRTEVASWARYEGPKPASGMPHFLKPRQIHVRLFETDDGETVVTAHEEATAWRPDLWQDHYGGETVDVDLGRVLVAYDLGYNDVVDEATVESSSNVES